MLSFSGHLLELFQPPNPNDNINLLIYLVIQVCCIPYKLSILKLKFGERSFFYAGQSGLEVIIYISSGLENNK